MLSHALHHDPVGVIEGELVLIDTLTYESIVYVCNRHDACFDRDLFALKAFGVARAVPSLVMVVRDVYCDLVEGFILGTVQDLIDDARSLSCMLFHLRIFFGSKLSGLS